MLTEEQNKDPWKWPAVGLWLVFFALGLLPGWFYEQFRAIAQVSTRDACINNYHLIPLLLTMYLAFFIYRQCVETGLTGAMARAKALEIGTISLVGFMPVRLEQAGAYFSIPIPFYRNLLLAVLGLKLLVWTILLAGIISLYTYPAFCLLARLPVILPSERHHTPPPDQDRPPGPGNG